MVNIGGGEAIPFDIHFGTTIGELLLDVSEVIKPSNSSTNNSAPSAQNLPKRRQERPKPTIYNPSNKPSTSGLIYIPIQRDIVLCC